MERDINELQKRVDKNNNEFTVISHDPITDNTTLKCKKCGFTFETTNYRQTGKKIMCKICGENPKCLTLQNIKDQVTYFSNGTMEFISEEYIGCKDKYEYLCKKCNKITTKTHDRFKAGERCYHCSMEEKADRQRAGWESLKERLEELYPGDTFTLLDEDDPAKITVQNRINFNCHKCGRTSKPLIRHLLYENTNCSWCSESDGEKLVREALTENNIYFIQHYKGFEDCKNTKILEFDFYLPDLNTIIEFDGAFHRNCMGTSDESIRKFKNGQENDKIKNKYCEDNNINLIRISKEKEIKNIINNLIK